MTITLLLAFLMAQPWVVVLPLVGFALLDGILGYLAARKLGDTFSWVRFADFMENSVGAHQLGWVIGSVVLVYLSGGTAVAMTTLVTLGGINGIVYLKVLADLKQKVTDLMQRTPSSVSLLPPPLTLSVPPPAVISPPVLH